MFAYTSEQKSIAWSVLISRSISWFSLLFALYLLGLGPHAYSEPNHSENKPSVHSHGSDYLDIVIEIQKNVCSDSTDGESIPESTQANICTVETDESLLQELKERLAYHKSRHQAIMDSLHRRRSMLSENTTILANLNKIPMGEPTPTIHPALIECLKKDKGPFIAEIDQMNKHKKDLMTTIEHQKSNPNSATKEQKHYINLAEEDLQYIAKKITQLEKRLH